MAWSDAARKAALEVRRARMRKSRLNQVENFVTGPHSRRQADQNFIISGKRFGQVPKPFLKSLKRSLLAKKAKLMGHDVYRIREILTGNISGLKRKD